MPEPTNTRDAAPVQLACDRCTQGVMDSTNPHLLGTCACPCHQDPTQRVEATTTPEGREGWDEPRHPEAGEAMASLPPLRAGADAIPEGVRAEIRDEEDGDGRDPGSAPTAASPRDLSVHFSSQRMDWPTPRELFAQIHAEFLVARLRDAGR